MAPWGMLLAMAPEMVSRRTVCALAMAAVATSALPRALRQVAAAPATERSHLIEDWHEDHVGKHGIPSGWERYATPGSRARYDFAIVDDSGTPALDLRSHNEHSTIAKEITVDLAATPMLAWQWKMISLPMGADLRHGRTCDASGHLFVVWPRWPALLRSRLIGYVWDPRLRPGTVVHSPKTGTVTFIIVRAGSEQLGRWVTEQRDVRADYHTAFGGRPDNPRAIALSIDTNDTHSSAEAMFGRIAFTSA